MDFTLSDEQSAIRELAARILGDLLPPERLRSVEQDPRWYADDAWSALGDAGLLGICLPEADGGGGYGLTEACLVAEEIGRRVAPLPYLTGVVAAGMSIATFGTESQRAAHLPGLIAGRTFPTIALYEPTDAVVPGLPVTSATKIGAGWRLDGDKAFVVGADRATTVLVPARTGERTSTVFLVDPTAAGVELAREAAVSREPQFTVHLRGVEVAEGAALGELDGGAAIVAWIHDRLTAAICAMQTGVCEEALAITARYVNTREQFGAKLGTFQAVGHRIADAYIDTEGIRLTATQAIWRIDAGQDAHDELMVAKYWASEGAQRVVHAAQHLHGGIGMDLDYPIHRYFRWAKVLELMLGGASPSLLRLGASLVGQPVTG
ncbi:MAG: acyl-CoA dehydrogenase family protein [Microthrixaceae bacterium]